MTLAYPAAVYKPLGAQTEPTMNGHDIVCAHTMVGYLSSTDRYFRATNGAGYNGTESHYGIGGPWGPDGTAGLDGTVWQWQDRGHQADANLQGSRRVLSIETADNAPRRAEDIAPWSPAQLDALVALIAWECSPAAHAACPPSWTCHREGIPAVLIPDTLPGRRGIGHHRQGCDPWRVDGGERWSTAYGKACPGDARITQLQTVVIPRVTAVLGGAVPSPRPAPMPPAAQVPAAGRKREPRPLGVIRRGMTGPLVGLWQAAAGATPDQVFGPRTEAAVKALQGRLGVGRDGMAGPLTLRAYLESRGLIRRGDQGVAVAFVQAIGGVATDHDFGPITEAAVCEMQRWAGIDDDGVVGPDTRNRIVR